MNAYRRRRGTAPPILNISTIYSWLVNLKHPSVPTELASETFWAFYNREKCLERICIRTPDCAVRSRVAVQTWLIPAPYLWVFYHGATAPPLGPMPPHNQGFMITLRHTTVGRTPLDEWSARRRDLYLTAHKSLAIDLNASGGFRTRNPSKRTTIAPRLRPLGHWDLQIMSC